LSASSGSLDENERRQGLSQSDRVRAVEQLAAFGVTPDQIAKRTRTKRARGGRRGEGRRV
jgi:ParB-like chromosome segregation protein Spo0J